MNSRILVWTFLGGFCFWSPASQAVMSGLGTLWGNGLLENGLLENGLLDNGWTLSSSLNARLLHDSNRGLVVTNAVATTSLEERLTVSANRAIPGLNWQNSLRLYNREDDTRVDINDQSLEVDTQFSRSWERLQTQLGLSWSNLDRFTTDDLVEGNDSADLERNMTNANMSASYAAGPSTLYQARVSIQEAAYADERSSNLYDYEYYQLNLRLQKTLNPVFSVNTNLFTSQLNNVTHTNEHFSYGVSTGVSWNISEASRMSLDLGFRETDYKTELFDGFQRIQFDDRRNGVTSRFTFTRKGERTQLDIRSSRQILPNGVSETIERRSLSTYFLWRHTDRVSSSFDLEAWRHSSDVSLFQSSEFNAAQFKYQAGWKFKKNWRLSAGYRYLYRDLTNSSNDPKKNVVFVSFTWKVSKQP